MKITFFTNFLTHHQLPFCLEMVKIYGDDFKFISTEKINEERLKLGYSNMDDLYDFVIKSYESKEEYKKAMDLALNSDVVIAGSTTSDEYVKERLKQDKLTFRYYARIFYKKSLSIFDFKNLRKVYDRHFRYKKNKNLHLLCASSYGPNDFNKFGMYINKAYKWGYFLETKTYDEKELLKQKEADVPVILWVGRLIKVKHPEYVIKLANYLRKEGYKFKIQVVGNGPEYEPLKKRIEKYNLSDYVELVGAVKSENVRSYMEKAKIFICTSDQNERWGAVINEAMNSGCQVVANKFIGSVPFLIKNRENGLTYTNIKEYYEAVKELLDNKEFGDKLSINAYRTIHDVWTAENAVKNLGLVLDAIINNKDNPVKVGPGSNTYPVK